MNSPNRSKNPKAWVPFGTLCLAASLLLFLFVHPAPGPQREWLHGISGLLMGISLGISLMVLVKAARQRYCAKT
jgi:hypothetical protein